MTRSSSMLHKARSVLRLSSWSYVLLPEIHTDIHYRFNAGSALAANMRAIMAAVVTNLAACIGGLSWCLMDYRYEGKWSTVGFCSGVVAGLVAITPASGFVPPWAAVVIGICAGESCSQDGDSSRPSIHVAASCIYMYADSFNFRHQLQSCRASQVLDRCR